MKRTSPRLQAYRRRKEGEELRSDLGMALFVLGLSALGAIGFGATMLDSLRGWLLLLGGFALGGVTAAMYLGHAWARWPAAAVFAAGLVAVVVRNTREGWDGFEVVEALFYACILVVLVLPETGKRMRFVRGAQPDSAGTDASPST